jgi:hypothetical protein
MVKSVRNIFPGPLELWVSVLKHNATFERNFNFAINIRYISGLEKRDYGRGDPLR